MRKSNLTKFNGKTFSLSNNINNFLVIKNIIFDLGGVILNIDYNLTVKAFKSLGVNKFDSLYSQAMQSNLFDDFEVGKISDTQFIERLKTNIDIGLKDDAIINAWNAMLLDLPLSRIEMLKMLNDRGYRCFLLSNTNEIHLKEYSSLIEKEYGIGGLNNFFEKTYYSHQIGFRKPNANAFEYVLSDAQILKAETIFIDDSIQHIDGAKKVGLSAYHHQEGEIEDVISKLL